MAGTLFNFGPLEILAVVALTLILFGPERLPGLFRQFGEGIRKFRNYYLVLAEQIRKELEPVSEDLGEIRQVMHDVQADLHDIRNAVDLRAMLPPLNIAEELQNGDASKVVAHVNMAQPTAALDPSAQMYGDSHVQAVPLINSSPDANLSADNPWAVGIQPSIANKSEQEGALLSDDNPWAK